MPLKFGVCVNAVDPPREFAALVRRIESGGFEYFWVADISILAREAIAYLTLAAVETSTIRLGPSVFHPFVRHPAYSVNTIATLDEISGGRCILGMGLGGREVLKEVGGEPATLAELRDWVELT